jgi:hypothetical protein
LHIAPLKVVVDRLIQYKKLKRFSSSGLPLGVRRLHLIKEGFHDQKCGELNRPAPWPQFKQQSKCKEWKLKSPE